MHRDHLHLWQHDHCFGQELRRPGERRTLVVFLLTLATMVVEVAAGVAFGSMALFADGLHMASHALALGVNAFAYFYARRHAHDPRFSFGTGKVNALGGFSGALLLVVFAGTMAWESSVRLVQPLAIQFDQAIWVAILGLLVNGASALILGLELDHEHSDHRHDHNLMSAYLHVLADALTSVLAIAALLFGKYFGLIWMDPAMGIAGAGLVARWAYSLLRTSSAVLLDHQGPESMRREIQETIEADGDSRIADLHLWRIGPGIYASVVTVVAHQPATPEEYRARLPKRLGLAHVSIEVHRCPPDRDLPASADTAAKIEAENRPLSSPQTAKQNFPAACSLSTP